mgnify:CR=1 FL=1
MMAAVDRSGRVNSYRYARKNPNRVVVQVDENHIPGATSPTPFLVYRGFEELGAYATFGEAINEAQKRARD